MSDAAGERMQRLFCRRVGAGFRRRHRGMCRHRAACRSRRPNVRRHGKPHRADRVRHSGGQGCGVRRGLCRGGAARKREQRCLPRGKRPRCYGNEPLRRNPGRDHERNAARIPRRVQANALRRAAAAERGAFENGGYDACSRRTARPVYCAARSAVHRGGCGHCRAGRMAGYTGTEEKLWI